MYASVPKRKLRPIVRPGTPRWAVAFVAVPPGRRGMLWMLGAMAFMAAGAFGSVWPFLHDQFVLGGALLFTPMAVLIGGGFRYRTAVVAPQAYRFEGVALSFSALDMLEDIQGRFDFAHKLVDEVPTGIDWRDVAPHIEVLLWECAGHGARLTRLDGEVGDLRYAASGTPQAALRDQLMARRAEHWHALVDVQHQADSLAREAGNAVAAARVALARTGSLRALEVVAPSAQAIMAKGALEQARTRLSMLAEAWTELDDSGQLLGEELGLNRPERPRSTD